jgi:hypothetical protein
VKKHLVATRRVFPEQSYEKMLGGRLSFIVKDIKDLYAMVVLEKWIEFKELIELE